MSTPMVTMMVQVASTVPSIISDCAVWWGGDHFIHYTPICGMKINSLVISQAFGDILRLAGDYILQYLAPWWWGMKQRLMRGLKGVFIYPVANICKLYIQSNKNTHSFLTSRYKSSMLVSVGLWVHLKNDHMIILDK